MEAEVQNSELPECRKQEAKREKSRADHLTGTTKRSSLVVPTGSKQSK